MTRPKTAGSKTLALFLVCAAVFAPLAGHASLMGAAASHRLAGCHEHAPKAPVPTPVSYQCCSAGHHSAIVKSAHSEEFALLEILPASGFPAILRTVSLFERSRDLVAPSGESPGGTPLRI